MFGSEDDEALRKIYQIVSDSSSISFEPLHGTSESFD